MITYPHKCVNEIACDKIKSLCMQKAPRPKKAGKGQEREDGNQPSISRMAFRGVLKPKIIFSRPSP